MSHKKPVTIRLNAKDNVAVALRALGPGVVTGRKGATCREHIPAGHKVAIREINARDPVLKYGHIIGFASKTIQPGYCVHTHNMEMGEAIFQLVLEIASGKRSKSELLGFGDNEFVPWHIGAVM